MEIDPAARVTSSWRPKLRVRGLIVEGSQPVCRSRAQMGTERSYEQVPCKIHIS